MNPEEILHALFASEKAAAEARKGTPSGHLSTDSNALIPDGWVEVTCKSLIKGELVRRSYVGPLVREMDTIVGVEIDGSTKWFPKTAWTVTRPVPYPRIEDFS